jgi:N utilization substance protein B
MKFKTEDIELREFAFGFLYQLNDSSDIDSDSLEEKWTDYCETLEKSNNAAFVLVQRTLNKKSEIENKISPHTTTKINAINNSILKLGTYELLFSDSMTSKEVINMYIDLAKKFGTNESYSLVNAVLDKIAKEGA